MTSTQRAANSGGENATPHVFAHHAMACRWGIQVRGHDRRYAEQAAGAAFAEIDRLEGELSRFVEASDVARLSRVPRGGALRLGPDAFACLELAAQVGADTRGAFDVTIGAWLRPGAVRRDAGQPRLALDRATRSVLVLADGVEVDLGGIGKGHAVDAAMDVLREWKIDAALVHAGQSTVLALGDGPAGAGWCVAVRDPAGWDVQARQDAPSADRRTDDVLGRILLRDTALSGSGMSLHGPHVVDPRSGAAARRSAAWSLAPTAALADALSTAFLVMTDAEITEYCAARPECTALLPNESAPGAPLRCFGAPPHWQPAG